MPLFPGRAGGSSTAFAIRADSMAVDESRQMYPARPRHRSLSAPSAAIDAASLPALEPSDRGPGCPSPVAAIARIDGSESPPILDQKRTSRANGASRFIIHSSGFGTDAGQELPETDTA
jgi:hypothetical protein